MKKEISPLYSGVIIRPYDINPYLGMFTEEGLDLGLGEFDNPDSGEKDNLSVFIKCGEVFEAGPDCKYVKQGDDVFYDSRSTRPVPFMRCGFVLGSEQNLLCVMNDDLNKREWNKK